MKNITIFSKHFWPENFKINDVCFYLSKKYKINVYTSYPGYNNLNYKIIKKNKINYKGLKINYFKSFNRLSNSFISIFLDYFLYLINLFLKINFSFKDKTSICITFATSPVFQALPAIYYSKIKKIPSIIWVQDLWPEVLEDTGYVKNKFVLKLLDKIVKYIYNETDIIIAQSESFKNHLKKKYKLKNKLFTLHQPSEYVFQKRNRIKKNNFKITYAGNFGKAQDFNTILQAFSSNKINKNISLYLIGSGKKLNYIKKKIKENKLYKRVFLINYKNKKILYKLLRDSSCFFLSLNDGKSLNKTIPGKFQTYVSFGKPIIICSNSDLNNFIKNQNIGFASRPKQVNKLINNINKSYKLTEIQKKKIYISSRDIYKNLFAIKKVTSMLEEYINLAYKTHAKKTLS